MMKQPSIRTKTVYTCDGHRLEFVKVRNVPDFSHRVMIDDKPVDWLSDRFKPSRDTAAFFFHKHVLQEQP